MEQCDLILYCRWVAPVAPADTVLEQHALAIRDGAIRALLPAAEAAARYEAAEVVHLDDHLVIPGLVNAHTHAAMSLFRGLADDLPLEVWLREHIWPAEGRWIDAEFVRDGTRLAIAEMLLGGTTCFNDMYFFPDVVAETAAAARIRASVGMILVDVPTPWAKDAGEYLSKGVAVHDRYASHPLVSTHFAPHAPYSVSEASLGKLRALADQLDVPVHMHVHETAAEVAAEEEAHGMRPLERLRRLGFVNGSLLAVHMTAITDEEIAMAAEAGVSVAHCPESNLKLASGIAPVSRMLAAGINVALGTDGAASNNDLDMLSEMRTAALLGKAAAGDASALSAHTVLRMATLNGAAALGLADSTGSLEPGKWADVCAVDLSAPRTQPVYEPVSQLVYAAEASQVTDVWVAGQRLVKKGRLAHLHLDDISGRAAEWREKIWNYDHE
jgi:5-methylthioadenosine/S-adenosylhomocysteine deaminase